MSRISKLNSVATSLSHNILFSIFLTFIWYLCHLSILSAYRTGILLIHLCIPGTYHNAWLSKAAHNSLWHYMSSRAYLWIAVYWVQIVLLLAKGISILRKVQILLANSKAFRIQEAVPLCKEGVREWWGLF